MAAPITSGYEQRSATGAAVGADIMGGYGARTGYGQRGMARITGGWTELGAEAEGRGAGILGGYGQRTAGALSQLEGLGAYEAADINRRYDAIRAGEMADLTSRGLRSSTVASNVTQGIERERTQELGGLQERLRRLPTGGRRNRRRR